MKSFAETEKVNVVLGFDCNFACRYCTQHTSVLPNLTKSVDKETINFLQRAADVLPRNRKKSQTLKVDFVGGEPLLYFPIICDIIERVNRENIEWSFSTNGSLLNNEIVSYINNNNIRMFFSHDGPYTYKTRGVDVLDNLEIVKCLKEIRFLGVNSLLTAYSQNIYEVNEFFQNKFKKNIPIKLSFLKLASLVQPDMVNYDTKAWKETCKKMSSTALSQFLTHEQGWESDFYGQFITSYYSFIQGKNPIQPCSTFGNSLTIDFDGKIWICRERKFFIGNASSSCLNLHRETEKRLIRLYQENKRYCIESCHWYPYCLGGCPREEVTAQQKKQCEFLSIFYASVEWLMNEFETTSQRRFQKTGV